MQWYGRGGQRIPSGCAGPESKARGAQQMVEDSLPFPYQMSANAPSFVPGAPQARLQGKNVSTGTPHAEAASTSSTAESSPRTVDRFMSRSENMSTVTGSSSECANEADTLASARSELTSEDATCSMSPQRIASPEHESHGSTIPNLHIHCHSADVCKTSSDGVEPSLVSYDSSCNFGGDCLLIDPEAANPLAEETEQMIAKSCDPQDRDADRPAIEEKKLRTSEEGLPCLDVVVGSWLDSKGSTYEVSFDEGTTSSCYVKTVRPCGLTRETSALIRARQVRGKPVGRILWGSAYVLEFPIDKPHQLHWRSIRGGKDFTWIKADVMDAAKKELESAQVPGHALAPSEVHPSPNVQEPGTEAQPSTPNDLSAQNRRTSRTQDRMLCSRRVWRAKQEDVAIAAQSEVPKTPSEVAAAPCRSVKSKNGEWRTIKKDLPK